MPRAKDRVVKYFTHEGKVISASGKNEKEAIENLALKKKELESGRIIKGGNTLVKDWVAVCYDKYKTNVTEETKKKDREKAKKWICDTIGNMPLKRVKPMDVQDVMNALEGYSEAHIKKVYQLFDWVFGKAVENDMIAKNPVQGVARPKGTKTTRRAITDSERYHLLAVADKVPKLRFYLFMLYCGCRPSEVANIKGMDIQKDQDGNPVLHIRGTKTANADRIVPIPKELFERLPKNYSPFEYLFTTKDGNPYDAQAMKRLWKRCKREMNINMGCRVYRNELVPPYPLKADLVPYCFRHTYCTDLAKAKIPIEVAQKLMGHSDISLTANIYFHIDGSMVSEASEALNKYHEQHALKVVK